MIKESKVVCDSCKKEIRKGYEIKNNNGNYIDYDIYGYRYFSDFNLTNGSWYHECFNCTYSSWGLLQFIRIGRIITRGKWLNRHLPYFFNL